MPLYEFECPECKRHIEELLPIKGKRKSFVCTRCNKKMYQVLSRPSLLIWKPLTLDHIADKPMTFNSKDDLRKYCRKHGLASSALL